MGNRLVRVLSKARKNKRKLFCAYVTLGYPSLRQTESLALTLQNAGTDILELGFPFSDPLADGPTIQYASEQSIKKGTHFEDSFRVMRRLRREGFHIPVLFFSYFNPIHHYGVDAFVRKSRYAGLDGAIIPDLPPDEARSLEERFHKAGLSLVYLVAPTTERTRMKHIAKRSNGFVYYVSLRGVTGARRAVPADLTERLRLLKRQTSKAILVGFGVSHPGQVRSIARNADGIVVGSAIIDRLRRGKGIRAVGSYVSRLVRALNPK